LCELTPKPPYILLVMFDINHKNKRKKKRKKKKEERFSRFQRFLRLMRRWSRTFPTQITCRVQAEPPRDIMRQKFRKEKRKKKKPPAPALQPSSSSHVSTLHTLSEYHAEHRGWLDDVIIDELN